MILTAACGGKSTLQQRPRFFPFSENINDFVFCAAFSISQNGVSHKQ